MTDEDIYGRTISEIGYELQKRFGNGISLSLFLLAECLADVAISRWKRRGRHCRVPWQVGRRISVGGRAERYRKRKCKRGTVGQRLIHGLTEMIGILEDGNE